MRKRLTALTLVIALLAAPSPTFAQAQAPQNDWCMMSRKMGLFATMNAFAFGLMPALQPVGVIFAGVAIVFKGLEIANCH